MISYSIRDGVLEIRLSGWALVAGLRRRINVPLTAITAVHPLAPGHRPPTWRLPGTCIPGVITAGTYRGNRRTEFWHVRSSRQAWIIELAGQDLTAIVLDVEPPAGLAPEGALR